MIGTINVQVPEPEWVDAGQALLMGDSTHIQPSVHGGFKLMEVSQDALRCGVVEDLLGALLKTSKGHSSVIEGFVDAVIAAVMGIVSSGQWSLLARSERDARSKTPSDPTPYHHSFSNPSLPLVLATINVG
jgi:hypothetical protein